MKKRHNARQLIVQALYQLECGGHTAEAVEEQSSSSPLYEMADTEYFHNSFAKLNSNKEEIDSIIDKINRNTPDAIDTLTRSVLQLGVYELLYEIKIDHPVIIKEAIVLCEEFLNPQSHGFVNSILDEAARKIRQKSDS